MTDFPKTIDCGDFRLEKVAPTFDTARYLFELVDSQRESQIAQKICIRIC